MGSGAGKTGGFTPIHVFHANEPDMYFREQRYNKFREISEESYPIWAIAVAPRLAGLLATAAANCQVHLWELTNFEIKVTLDAHEGVVWDVAFSPDESTLATASSDNTIRLWSVWEEDSKEVGVPLAVLKGHTDWVRSLSFGLSSGGLLMSCAQDSQLALWQRDNPLPVKMWKGHEGPVTVVAYSPAEPLLAFSTGVDGSLALWDAEYGTLLGRFPGADGGAVLCIDPHPTNIHVIATGIEDGTVWLWFLMVEKHEGATKPARHNTLRGHSQAVTSVRFSPNGAILASASSDSNVRLWDVRNLDKPVLTGMFKAHETFVRCLQWTNIVSRMESGQLLTAGIDGKVKLWQLPKSIRKIVSGAEAYPPVLYISIPPQNPHTECSGKYELWVYARSTAYAPKLQVANGMQVYKQHGTERYLYSGNNGQWFVGEGEDGFDCAKGWLGHPEKHWKQTPEQMKKGEWEWHDGDTFITEPEIAVSVDPPPGFRGGFFSVRPRTPQQKYAPGGSPLGLVDRGAPPAQEVLALEGAERAKAEKDKADTQQVALGPPAISHAKEPPQGDPFQG